MKEYNIPNDFNVIGLVVESFPNGIGEAFEGLVKRIPGGFSRPYYGIAKCIDDKMVYIAAALEESPGEGEELKLERYRIEKGKYLAVKISDWQSKTACIKDVFGEMYTDERADRSKPSIEIYQNEKEMLCLVKMVEYQKKSQEPIPIAIGTRSKEISERCSLTPISNFLPGLPLMP